MPVVLIGSNETIRAYESQHQDLTRRFRILDPKLCVCVYTSGHDEAPSIVRTKDEIVLCLGHPFIEQGHEPSYITPAHIQCLEEGSLNVQNVASLNGCFLIVSINQNTGTTKVFTDRFGSYNCFLFVRPEKLIALSTQYSRLTRSFSSDLDILETSLYQFIRMRRLYNDTTFHRNISRLGPGEVTEVRLGRTSEVKRTSYWVPKDFENLKGKTIESNAKVLYDILSSSVKKYLAKEGRHGLFLSGGLDSRALLGIGGDKYITYTNGTSENNEYNIAKSLAGLAGASHCFLYRPRNLLEQHFSESISSSNGMTVYYETPFIHYGEKLRREVDNVHLGLGMDILFCGHYMAKSLRRLSKWSSLSFILNNLGSDVTANDYVEQSSYRLKTSSVDRLVSIEQKDVLNESLYAEIERKLGEGRKLGATGHSLWEFVHCTDIGRHYSMLMASSIRPFVDVVIPALENELYDLSFQIPVEQKYNWSAYIQALKYIDMDMMKIVNSNTNLQAGFSLRKQTILKTLRGFANTIPGVQFSSMPAVDERSWPHVSESISENKAISNRMKMMAESGAINDLRFIRSGSVSEYWKEHCSNARDHTILLSLLLTLEEGVLSRV